MANRVRINDRGQVLIPPNVRHQLGVGPGDNLLFEVDGQVARVRSAKGRSRFAKYRGIGNPGLASGRKSIIAWNRRVRGR